jgi:hypothetical protein
LANGFGGLPLQCAQAVPGQWLLQTQHNKYLISEFSVVDLDPHGGILEGKNDASGSFLDIFVASEKIC